MASDALLHDIQEMAKFVKQQLPGFDEDKFIEAFIFARDAHEGQVRKDGSPYIIHPIETARTLSRLKVDEDTLIAALLHDVPEDTSRTVDEIHDLFGEKIAFLVEGITKLSKVHYQNDMESRQVESLRKLLIHTAKDPRVILVKLADRLHNMQTLHFITKEEKRARISRETLEIYVPMASLLGIQGIKSQLEDLCFQYLHPDEFEQYREKNAESERHTATQQEATMQRIRQTLREHDIQADVFPRKKTLFSIFRKIVSQRKSLCDVYDLITIRILVPTVEDAYRVLGLIHVMFKPRVGKFKDYIAVPKINGYRSLHTTVFGIDGVLTEFQIRTFDMDQEAEYGITTFYFLSSKKKGAMQSNEEWRTRWMEQILDLEQHEITSRQFMQELKADIFEDKMFVFTPKGDAIHLPRNSTAIDFAYMIHSDVGNTALSADINGLHKPMNTTLRHGDTVNIVTSADDSGPKREWLEYARTNLAKTRIREFLNKESVNIKIQSGKELLQKVFYTSGIGLISDISYGRIRAALIASHFPDYETIKDLYIAIGEGALSPGDVIRSLYPEQKLSRIARGDGCAQRFLQRISRAPVDECISLKIVGPDRPGLVEDVVSVLRKLNVNILKITGYGDGALHRVGIVKVTFDVERYDTLQSIINELRQIEDVVNVVREYRLKEIGFIAFAFFTIVFWLLHPILIHYFVIISRPFFIYTGLILLLVLVFYLRRFASRFISKLRDGLFLFLLTTFITIFVVATLLFEMLWFDIFVDLYAVFALVAGSVSYLAYQYVDYRRKRLF